MAYQWQVLATDLEPVGHVSHTNPVAIRPSQYNHLQTTHVVRGLYCAVYLVSALDQALREHVNVRFDATHAWSRFRRYACCSTQAPGKKKSETMHTQNRVAAAAMAQPAAPISV